MPATTAPSADPQAKLVDVQTVAIMLGVSARTVRRLSDSGRMPRPRKLSSLLRWDKSELDEWIRGGCRALRTASPKAGVR